MSPCVKTNRQKTRLTAVRQEEVVWQSLWKPCPRGLIHHCGDTEGMSSVLFVCTANRIRSPLAEASFCRAVGSTSLRVESAGTLTTTAGPVKEALVAASRLGLDLSQHSARTIWDVDLKAYDLILGFELSHVAAVVVDAGVPPSKVFTLREAVRLMAAAGSAADQDPSSRLRRVVTEADRWRRQNAGFRVTEQIDDPIGRGQDAVDRCALEIDALCAELARQIWAAPPGSHGC